MIRPELVRAARRWLEVWIGAAIGLGGFWVAGLGGWFFVVLGLGVGAVGLGTVLVGLRRLRVPRTGAAPGIVEVVEGQITYFAPESVPGALVTAPGGVVALSEIAAVTIADAPGPGRHWRIEPESGAPLLVPVAASGAEALFDLFASLPGARPGRIVAALEAPGGQRPVTVWRRDRPAALT